MVDIVSLRSCGVQFGNAHTSRGAFSGSKMKMPLSHWASSTTFTSGRRRKYESLRALGDASTQGETTRSKNAHPPDGKFCMAAPVFPLNSNFYGPPRVQHLTSCVQLDLMMDPDENAIRKQSAMKAVLRSPGGRMPIMEKKVALTTKHLKVRHLHI